MTQNMYRVGDYVYFECFTGAPYQIRRIEELNKTQAGHVEAKVVRFYRRRDLPLSLLKIADQAERQKQILSRPKWTLLSHEHEVAAISNGDTEKPKSINAEVEGIDYEDKSATEASKIETKFERSYGFAGLPSGAIKLSAEQIHELRQHELFLSRQYDTLHATQIRGKCTVVILNEVETCDMYLGHEDAYFFSLVYDPSNQTLLADKGRIEIGGRHQADIPQMISDDNYTLNAEGKISDSAELEKIDPNSNTAQACRLEQTDREQIIYHPQHSLTDRDIDQFLIIARAVGTFSRALDSNSGMKLPSLHMTASAASRDVTLLHAMALLHHANYEIGQATKFLVPPPNKPTGHDTISLGGPILCRDQLEEWSAAEATLFEDAYDKYGKDFHDIRTDCLPWKSIRDIVEYYYMWKTTARYGEKKTRSKAEDHKLKQVYIPTYNKPNPNLIPLPLPSQSQPITQCEGCMLGESAQWYKWGPAHLDLRLCAVCWIIWKKHGGLKRPHELELYDLPGTSRGGRGNNKLSSLRFNGVQVVQQVVSSKSHATFYLLTALEARIARKIAPKNVFNIRKSARSPFRVIDVVKLKANYFTKTLDDILKMGQQIRQRNLSKWENEHLTKLHQKRASASTATSPSPFAANSQVNVRRS